MTTRCLPALACLLTFVSGTCFGQEDARFSAPPEAGKVTEAQLVKMTQDVLALEVRRDLPAMAPFFTESYTHTHAVGLIESKAQFMAAFNPGTRKYKDAELSQIKVRFFGASAIVSGHERIGVEGGDHHYSFVAVWVQDQGQWRIATWVTSPNYPPAPGAPAH